MKSPFTKKTTIHLLFLLVLRYSFGWLPFAFSLCPVGDSRSVDKLIRYTERCFFICSQFSLPPQAELQLLSGAVVSPLIVAPMINPFAQVPWATNPFLENSFSDICDIFGEPKVSIWKSMMVFHIKTII